VASGHGLVVQADGSQSRGSNRMNAEYRMNVISAGNYIINKITRIKIATNTAKYLFKNNDLGSLVLATLIIAK